MNAKAPHFPGRLRDVLLLLGLATVLRGLWAATVPMIAGESYYWLWSQRLAAGYFDHPPMVALAGWLMGGWITGHPLAARMQSILLAIGSTFALYGLARAMYPGTRIPVRAAALMIAIPLFDLNGMFVTPDNALIFFTILTWLAFWRAAERPGGVGWWLAAGVFGGAALLSKFHAWVLLPPLYLFLCLSPRHRPALRHRGPWLALVLALLTLSPNLFWNARHGWINYAFQFQRSALPQSAFEWEHVLHYLLGPLLTLSPVVYGAMLAALPLVWRTWRRQGDPRILYLACAGVPLPVFLGALTPLVQISLHWPGAGYVAWVLLAVALVEQGTLFRPGAWRWMFWPALMLTLLMHAAPYGVQRLPDSSGYPWHEYVRDLRRVKAKVVGWPEIGALVRRQQAALQSDQPDRPAIVLAKNWHLASNLAFYADLPLQTFVYNAEDAHNYRLWMKPLDDLKNVNAIVVIEKGDPNEQHNRFTAKYDKYHRLLDPAFEKVEVLPSLVCREDGVIEEYLGTAVDPPRLREWLIFRCTGYRGGLIEGE